MNPAETALLGAAGPAVTKVGVGTASIGGLLGAVSAESAADALAAALEARLNFFDTAPGYGYGLAEERLGDFLARNAGTRGVIATKVGRLLRPRTQTDPQDSLFFGANPLIDYFDFSYDGVMRSVEESLSRLRLDRVDVLYIHDPQEHHEEALAGAHRALLKLRDEGSVRAIGVGTTRLDELIRFATEGRLDCLLVAGRYTLLDQTAFAELLPLCASCEISVVVGGVFNSGIMANIHPDSTYEYKKVDPTTLDRARRIAAICDRHGVSPRAVALQFPFGSPAVRSVIPGVRSRDEVLQNVEAFESKIPTDLWEELKSGGLLPADVPTP